MCWWLEKVTEENIQKIADFIGTFIVKPFFQGAFTLLKYCIIMWLMLLSSNAFLETAFVVPPFVFDINSSSILYAGVFLYFYKIFDL